LLCGLRSVRKGPWGGVERERDARVEEFFDEFKKQNENRTQFALGLWRLWLVECTPHHKKGEQELWYRGEPW
jgi:hypothetical protein